MKLNTGPSVPGLLADLACDPRMSNLATFHVGPNNIDDDDIRLLATRFDSTFLVRTRHKEYDRTAFSHFLELNCWMDLGFNVGLTSTSISWDSISAL